MAIIPAIQEAEIGGLQYKTCLCTGPCLKNRIKQKWLRVWLKWNREQVSIRP
jgi:hypothetical protein